MPTSSKYYFFPIVFFGSFCATAQTNNTPQAVVTIVGDPAQTNTGNTNDFIDNNFNPYENNNTQAPPTPQQSAGLNQGTIDPTLENGFHVRFNLEAAQATENVTSSGYMSAGSSSSSGSVRAHKHVSMTERSFNMKKKIRTWMPKRKKKYRPHLCGRF